MYGGFVYSVLYNNATGNTFVFKTLYTISIFNDYLNTNC